MTELPRVGHVPGQLTVDDALPRPRLLSLFSGYGGLDMAVAGLLDADVIAHAEVDPAACRVLAHRFPEVRNLGDVRAVDWSTLGPVDVIVGGFPCQDVSLAGRRLGIAHDTRSGLWAHMAAAVDELHPSLVVIENVRGLLSARANHPAHSDVESCPWCVGGPDDVPLRALGAVLGDLADLGYDAAWRLVSAADVGAPHGRARVFAVAWPAADTAGGGLAERHVGAVQPAGRGSDAADADGVGRERGGPARRRGPGPADGREPAATDAAGRRRDGRAHDAVGGPLGGVAAAGGGAGAGRGSAAAADADGAGLERRGGIHLAPREGEASAHRRGAAADADGDGLEGLRGARRGMAHRTGRRRGRR